MSFWPNGMDFWEGLKELAAIPGEAWQEMKDDHAIYPGSVLRSRRGWYDHYGIYAGHKEVIHFSDGRIRYGSINSFYHDDEGVFTVNKLQVMYFDPDKTNGITRPVCLERAKSLLGREGYDLLENNCEHFALWCRTGVAVSTQASTDGELSISDAYPEYRSIAGTSAALNPSALIGKIIVDNALRRAMEKIRDIINEEYERKCGMGVSRELVDTSWIKDA